MSCNPQAFGADELEGIWTFLRSLPSLRSLRLRWMAERAMPLAASRKHLTDLFSTLPLLEDLKLELPSDWYAPYLAKILPSNLRRIELSACERCKLNLLDSLKDVTVLPKLTQLPVMDFEDPFRVFPHEFHQAWSSRQGPTDLSADTRTLRKWSAL